MATDLKIGNLNGGEKKELTAEMLVNFLNGNDNEIYLFVDTENRQAAKITLVKTTEGKLQAAIEAKAYINL